MTLRPASAPSVPAARSPRPPVPGDRWARAGAPGAPWSARVRAVGLASVLGLVAVLGGAAAPAAGHDTLTGSTPADGATVEVPPTTVDLTFAEPPLGIGTEIQLTGPDGAPVDAGRPVHAGTTVSLPLPAGLPAGPYEVAWRVTSSDGHPISGSLSFTATTGTTASGGAAGGTTGDPGTEPAAEPTAEPTAEPGAEPTAGGAATAAPPDLGPGTDVAADRAEGRGSPLPWLLGAAGLLAAAGLAWAAARRRSGGPGQA